MRCDNLIPLSLRTIRKRVLGFLHLSVGVSFVPRTNGLHIRSLQMVSTRGKTKAASSNRTPENNEAVENALAETLTSDAVTKVDVGIEDNVVATVDEPRNGKSEGMSGEEESKRDEAENENSEGMSGEEESERVTKLDNDYKNTSVEEMNGENKVEIEENTFEDDEIDDQGEMPWDDEEDNADHDNEERVVNEYDFSDDEVTEDDNEDDEVSEEEATEEDYEDDEVNGEEAIKEEDGEENTTEEKETAKNDATKVEGKEVGRKIEGQNTEKLEVSLKNKNKSSETNKKKKVLADGSKKVNLKDKPEPSHKRKVKKRVASMGMIFMCSSKTKKDCYQYKVFGLPESKKDLVEKIYTGMRLFLYDVDLKLMYGIYKAAGPGGYNIVPHAFKSQFPSQVRFKVLDNCLPLAEEKFKNVIKDNYYTKTKFDCQLNSEQVKKLCKLFVASSKGRPPKKLGKSRKAEKRPVTRERTRKRRPVPERHLPVREEVQYERPCKRLRKATNPPRQRPAPLPPIVPSSHAYERTSDPDAYRRDLHLDRRSPYRVRHELLDRHDPYGDRRNPPKERNDHYGDGRDTYLDRHYAYRDDRDLYVERRDPYRGDRDPYPRRRDPYRDGRDLYLELPDYRDRQDPYVERRDSYRDGRDAYLDRRLPYSELYSSYRRDLLSDRGGVDYRDSYRREELLERRDLPPSSSLDRARHDIVSRDPYASTRDRTSYAEPIYPAEYPPRTGLYRI